LALILQHLDLEPDVRLYYHGNKYYEFSVEELLIYTLRKMTTGWTHKDLTTEFGGCSTRWGRGYTWFIKYLDQCFARVIGPNGIDMWASQFPYFVEQIRQYVVRDNRGLGQTEPLLSWEWKIMIFRKANAMFLVSLTVPIRSTVGLVLDHCMAKKALQDVQDGTQNNVHSIVLTSLKKVMSRPKFTRFLRNGNQRP
jgi:hypothetical protein